MPTQSPYQARFWLLFMVALSVLCACDGSRPGAADTCQIDSDCRAGSMCGGDGLCTACPDDAALCGACEPGEVGCACLPDGSCNASQTSATRVVCDVDSQRCAAEMLARPVPTDPKCYTPCSNDLVLADGSLRRCAEDALMEGCIGLTVCSHGSCVLPETDDAEDDETGKASQALTRGCERDLDCPEFQACFEDGQCYSECEVNSECPADMACHKRVCRIECSTHDENRCPKGYLCASDDGELGYCRPHGEAEKTGTPTPPIDERFTLSVSALTLSNNTASATFDLTNESDVPLTFTLRKVDHVEMTDKGPRKETKNPLFWLSMGEAGNLTKERELEVPLGAHETRTIRLEDVQNTELATWEGHLEVFQPGAGAQTVLLNYSTSPDGLWAGRIYYMINFDDGGDAAITAFKKDPESESAAKETHNAFLVRWSDFVSDPLFSLEEWMALVDSTITGSWNYAAVREACEKNRGRDTKVRCFPYTTGDEASEGLSVYTDSDSERIPSGVLEMPFAMTLKRSAGETTSFEGRVQSTEALQYPGFPGVTLKFAKDPKSCGDSDGHCLVEISEFDVLAYTGARYLSSDGSCGSDVHALEQPWLVDSFTQGAVFDTDRYLRTECREASFPLSPDSAAATLLNASLSGTNPVPDGVRRERKIDLLDGRLINQDRMLLIVRERFDAKLGDGKDTGFSGYGLMMLNRQAANLSAEDYVPAEKPGAVTKEPPPSRENGKVMCPSLVAEPSVTMANAARQIQLLLKGDLAEQEGLTEIKPDSALKPQYLCHDTGRFNGGDPNWGVREPCPRDSRVTYFLHANDLSRDRCQGSAGCPGGECETEICDANSQCARESKARGTCAARLETLVAAGLVETPVVACGTPSTTDGPFVADFEKFDCGGDRSDLREGRVFFEPPEGKPHGLLPLNLALADAFRYKLAFLSRSGKSLGFVPSVCKPGSDAIPYCYAPAEVESVRDRVDCLSNIYRELKGPLAASEEAADVTAMHDLKRFLRSSFGAESDHGDDGFERLYAELLVMLADDAFTRALGSRFDLAGSATRSFEGDLFEPEGIRLSGGAGYEMRTLYQARQSYEMVLDRFYRLSDIVWNDVNEDDPELVEPETITNYVGRVVLASTKKASVTSEIARRYQGLGRADLARHVIERDYARAYLESVVLNQLFREYLSAVGSADAAGLQTEMARAQTLYSVALARMRETYQDLTDELTYFGDPPDFIPFPAPARFDLVAPQVMIERAVDTMRIAKERDDRALSSNRQFDTDSAQFNSELRRVQLSFENQLVELCGTIKTAEGKVLPLTLKYAAEVPALAVLRADPCGLGDTGQIHEQVGQVEVAATDLRLAIQEGKDILREVAIEQERVNMECNARVNIATLQYTGRGKIITLESEQRAHELAMSEWERRLALVDRTSRIFSAQGQALQAVGAAASNPLNIVSLLANGASAVAFGASAYTEMVGLGMQAAANGENRASQEAIHDKAEQISTLQATLEFQSELSQCWVCSSWDGKEGGEGAGAPTCPEKDRVPGPVRIQADARIKTLLIGLMRAQLNGLKADLELQIAQGRLAGLRQQATRLMAQADEAEGHLIDVEAARNDPNFRILRNADVLDADKAFHEALVDAYRATRVFEYYTAQSYGPKNELFLARLAARGEHSVENYLLDLQRALHNFENRNGRPEKRVHVVSMRDDIMRIARTDANGVSLSDVQRIALFRDALRDPSLLDERGYISVPFAVDELAVSPLTAIHRIEHVEAEIQGAGVGDRLGRIYLTPRGTATMRTLDEGHSFLRLPAVTAVVNTFFNGVKPSFVDAEVYQSLRLRERPLLNSLWELGLNQRDEKVNEDIQISELTDVRLYLYYEDFTRLD